MKRTILAASLALFAATPSEAADFGLIFDVGGSVTGLDYGTFHLKTGAAFVNIDDGGFGFEIDGLFEISSFNVGEVAYSFVQLGFPVMALYALPISETAFLELGTGVEPRIHLNGWLNAHTGDEYLDSVIEDFYAAEFEHESNLFDGEFTRINVGLPILARIRFGSQKSLTRGVAGLRYTLPLTSERKDNAFHSHQITAELGFRF